ncbi:MAG: iron ABC transporter permease [Varibaculum sp.]|nr:iron ABC transporter permease [Varibaculum sp.]
MNGLSRGTPRHGYRFLLGWLAGAILAAAILTIFFLIPVFELLKLGFGELTVRVTDGGLAALSQILDDTGAWSALLTTLLLAAGGTALATVFGVPAAYILYCREFPGRVLLRFLVVFPFVLPTVAVSAAMRALFDEGGWLGWIPMPPAAMIVTAMLFFNLSVVARTVGATWGLLNPDYAALARTLGAGPLRVFMTVTWPRIRGAVLSAVTVVFLYCSTAYGLVMVLGGTHTRTLETEIYRQTSEYLNLASAAVLSILQIVVVTVALLISRAAQRQAQRGANSETGRRAGAGVRPLQHRDLPLLTGVSALITVVIVLPLLQVVVRSLRRGGRWSVTNYLDLLRPGAARGIDYPIAATITESLRSALLATGIALVLATGVALLLTRHIPSATRNLDRHLGTLQTSIDVLFMLPLGVSAVTLGFGMLVALGGPLRWVADTPLLVPVAQALVAVPILIRIIVPALNRTDWRLYGVAASLGAGPLRAFSAVEWPMLRRALGTAAGFAFGITIGEFSATSFLVLQHDPTLPVMIYRLLARAGAADQGMAYAGTVLLCALAAAAMGLAETTAENRRVNIQKGTLK